jgi:hypothetical protein
MKNIYYIKANIKFVWEDWKTGFDWCEIEEGPLDLKTKSDDSEVVFFDKRKFQYLLEMKKKDIIVCHSSGFYYMDKKKKLRYKQMSRIVALGIVAQGGIFIDKSHKVTFRKILSFPKEILVSDATEQIPKAEPFTPGSNRFGITKLQTPEWKLLKTLITQHNSEKNVANKIKMIEDC